MNSRFSYDSAPMRLYWEITRACDLACRHCRAEAHPDADPSELSTAEGLRLLQGVAAFGSPLPHVVLTGGDPLKRRDLWDLIAHARGLGLAVSVSPSGTPLVTPEAIRRLKAAGVDAISLSFDGSTAERHDAIRMVPGCFDRTIDAARVAVETALPFQVNTLVCQETLDDVPALYPLVKDIGAARWSLFFLVTVGRGTVLTPISADDCEKLFEWLADRAMGQGGPIVTTTEAPHFRRILMQRARGGDGGGRRPPAHGVGIRDGNGIMFISHTGEVYPSGFLPIVAGNVREQDPVSIYRDSPVFTELRRPELFEGRCGRCEFRGPCGGSRSRAFAATGRVLAEDPLCPYEPAMPGARSAGPSTA
jgi:MoaA/NifB/PqqE/SkfB family radical SAM enzyme